MDEQQDVIGELEAAGVLAGIRWAYRAAAGRTLEIFSEADGHDAALLGNIRYTLFRDRLDRVFACEAYDLQPDSAPTDHLDLLYAELSQEDVNAMPHLAPDFVRRDDLTGSPGWAVEGRRFLLASCAFGKLDELPWPRKSPTKQRVARQRQPNPAQFSLFDDAADTEIAGLEELLASAYRLDLDTFVVAHTLDSVSHGSELVFGSPVFNSGGGQAWAWRHDLLAGPPIDGGRLRGDGPLPTGPNLVPDAPVRLRPKAVEQPADRASGEA
ncbi:MAG: hypothetical protein QOH56_370 [Pseudonocardiales bacterium]|jgi:hypothetical protein|nr:hypothetical protein [Pseudonocardiales bacterium]